MSNGINYISANEGGLCIAINDNGTEINRRIDTVEDGVYWIEQYGIADDVHFSSSMDFATEEFFETDNGAREFWFEIMVEANAVQLV